MFPPRARRREVRAPLRVECTPHASRELRVPRTVLPRATACSPGTVCAQTTGNFAFPGRARCWELRTGLCTHNREVRSCIRSACRQHKAREKASSHKASIATKVTLTRAEQETIALSSRSDGHRTHTVAVKKKEVLAAPYCVQGMYVLWFLAMSAERPRMSAGLGLLIKVDRGQRPRNVRGL